MGTEPAAPPFRILTSTYCDAMGNVVAVQIDLPTRLRVEIDTRSIFPVRIISNHNRTIGIRVNDRTEIQIDTLA